MIAGWISSHLPMFFSLFFGLLLLFSPAKTSHVLGESSTDQIEFKPFDQPVVAENKFPTLSAKSFLVVDIDSGTTLLAKNENVSLHPASITKIMTGLVSADYYKKEDVLVVKNDYPIGRNMGLKKGEQLTVFDLYLGLLVHSANDAAYVLADNYPGGIEGFIEAMNEKARAEGFSRTHFSNFDGEEDPNHYITAKDVAFLSREFLKNDLFSIIIEIDKATVWNTKGTIEHELETTNQLLGVVPEVRGLKTGWTQQAGECFVSYFQLEKDGQERRLVSVVLDSNDRFGETKTLIDWIKDNVSWRSISQPLN